MKRMGVLILALILMAISPANAEQYPKVFMIEEIDYESDSMLLIDCNGFEWEVLEPQDYAEGDYVATIMDDQGTEEIFDDEIISLRYAGFSMGEVFGPHPDS